MSLRDIDFPEKDQPLRHDVGLLGELVGKVIREQGGDELFECVERARRAAIARREGPGVGAEALEDALRDLDPSAAAEVVRAFSTYFQVVNLAERVHRIRRGRAHLRAGDRPQSGSLADTAGRLASMGVSGAEAAALFADARVEPVFTAHPTEATRRIILEKQDRIARHLIARLDPSRTPREERVALARIREDITAAWQTDEAPSERPTVADEREHVLYYVSRVLYRVLPALHEHVEEALRAEWPDITPAVNEPLIRVGSWVGGDMDGNPYVDADTVRATLDRHRELALRNYKDEVADLARQLSQSASRVGWSSQVDKLRSDYGRLFPAIVDAIPARHAEMGYRVLLELVQARIEATGHDDDRGYDEPSALVGDLTVVAASLAANGGRRAGLFGVTRLIRRVETFGFHLAVLDTRQDARELRDVLSDMLDDPDWPQRSSSERTARLHQLLQRAPTEAPSTSDRASRALDVFRALAEGRRRHGPDAVGPFIISMAQDVDDVLTVLWLAEQAGLGDRSDIPLDVAPLFETVPDLERAESVLDSLFTDPIAAPHLAQRSGRQMVMVGYSDSNKDGGIASARWALQQALEGMARSATRHRVRLTVFHGRGGTVSRGGGSVERAVAAMPAASIGGRLRLTEQGEVIDAKYGLPQIALRNLERMLGSIVLREAGHRGANGAPTDEAYRAIAEVVATEARGVYRSLVYEDPQFTPYFRAGTPIDVIERMAIGSRPASRRKGAGVQDLRAIPWVFSWTQCRAMLPGWYGLGSGLDAAIEQHGIDALREAARDWPFFAALLADVEMVLAKADLDIAAKYTALAPQDSLGVFSKIHEEYDRTVQRVLEIRDQAALLDGEPTLQRSIRLRNPYVDPMNVLQVDLLRRWRDRDRPEGPLFDALLASINGVARGLQNTG